ncbi:MAG: C-terminal binding protein, partial [Actinomycetota bacterium]
MTITDSPHLIPSAIPVLEEAGVEVAFGPEGAEPAQVASLAADSDAVMALLMPFDAASLAALERPRLLVRCGIGYDTIDIDAAAARGIAVANVPDYCVSEVADHTLALMLHLLRRLDSYRVRSGDTWT